MTYPTRPSGLLRFPLPDVDDEGHEEALHRDSDRNPDRGIPAVVKVVAVVQVSYIHFVIVVPIVAPVFRPRINRGDPIAAVLEAWIASVHHEGQPVNAETMVWTKVSAEAIIRNAISVVATTLAPVAMVGFPAL